METKKIANYLLSIYKTIEVNISDEIDFLNSMKRKNTPSKDEREKLFKLYKKYEKLVLRLTTGGKNNRLAKIAVMNNICFYYYEGALEIKDLQAEVSENILLEINEDIKTFNRKYTDISYINTIESKYIDMMKKFMPMLTEV